jgi:hypothetical protein
MNIRFTREPVNIAVVSSQRYSKGISINKPLCFQQQFFHVICVLPYIPTLKDEIEVSRGFCPNLVIETT